MTKKKLIIIVSTILLILLAVSFWAYSLLNGSPATGGERFANFPWGRGGETTEEFPNNNPVASDNLPVVNVSGQALRQLTFRPVIGYNEITNQTESTVRYVEAGTGHVYDINLETGREERVSNITIPNAQTAIVLASGNYVLVRSDKGTDRNLQLLSLMNDTATERSLSLTTIDITPGADDTFYYTTRSQNGLEAKQYNIATASEETLFTVPFISAAIQWSTPNTPHLVYTKPTSELRGYNYEINNSGDLIRLPFTGNGLTSLHTGEFIVYSFLTGGDYKSFIYDRRTGETSNAPIVMLPEKCTISPEDTAVIFCGHELTTYDKRFPDNWHKGIVTYNDSLWAVQLDRKSAIQLAIPETITGRSLDIHHLSSGQDTEMIYFLNRTDKTLWVYDIEN